MSERSAVQNPMLAYAEAIGWERIGAEQALEWRGGDRGLFFTEILREQLLALNPGVVTQTNVDEIIRQLSLLPPTIQGNQKAFAWMKGEQSVFVASEKRERNVRLIDFEHTARNRFFVTDEWWQRGVAHRNRADVVFLINGLPVAVAETKCATKLNGLEDGITQIRRYHAETPEMFTHAQLFEVTELIRFYYGVSWSISRKGLFNWKQENRADKQTYEATIKGFFDRERFLNMLQHYVVFLTKEDDLSKIILRQHQTRAVEKVLTRALEPDKYRGLIWHTQGSGKTLTMITIASRLLREVTTGEKPTVIMLIDRNELEGQLEKNLIAYGIQHYEMANSKKRLQELLKADYRGLIVSMIHKFKDIPKDANTRKGVIVLVDEAHRTTGGDLGNYLMGALPNATYVGFTGTPIDKLHKGAGTFKVFGVDDPEKGYLDKYSIAESIEDGTTVALNYSLAPSELMVDRVTLEKQFLGVAESEGVSDIEELNAILDRAVELKEMMKTPKRVAAIASFVAQHFKENVEPMGFKAFMVGVDREACVLYKQELDKHLPLEYSTVVYSGAHNDPAHLKQHQLDELQEKEVRRQFIKKSTTPKILIVTEKLLTGFDAPILYALYLDKPMRDHVLLQTIARVNRPYEDADGQVKPYGFVLDFVGIFEKLEKALAFDSDVVAACIQNLDVLKQLFEATMKAQAPVYLEFAKGFDDKSKDRAIKHFEEKKKREEFFKFFRDLERLYDVLSPDAFLRPYIKPYECLAALYLLIRNAYSNRPYVDRELANKTRALLREHTEFSGLDVPGQIHKLGENELNLIRDSSTSETTKILNLRKLLAKVVGEEAGSKPFLISIGERAEKLAEAYEDRLLTTQQTLEEFWKLTAETVHANQERDALGLDENSFAIFTTLRAVTSECKPEHATEINNIFARFPDYQWNQQERNKLRGELYRVLLRVVGDKKMIDVANTLLKLQRV